MDWVGAAVVAVAIAAIVFAAIEVPARGWADQLVAAIAGVGLLAAVVFVIVELRSSAPLLDVRLFARRGFGAGSLSVTIQFLVTFGVFLLLVQYLQLILGYGPAGLGTGVGADGGAAGRDLGNRTVVVEPRRVESDDRLRDCLPSLPDWCW